jgi:ABC-2 type transport system ATP-binding protein
MESLESLELSEARADLAIETVGLVKQFGAARAVDGVDLRVRRGMVYGFLGPNGAGKTTTIRMLATLLRPDGGVARVFGRDVAREPDAVRRRVSLTGQFASVDGELTGLENLTLLGRLLGLGWRQARARAGELLAIFGLAEAANRPVKKYSGGMRRRLDIAASLIVTPDLLFLDEPTTGLDPRSRNMIWATTRAIVAEGATVLLTTQYLDEADQLADRIAVIDQGKIIAEGTPSQLKASIGAGVAHVRLADPERRAEAAEALGRLLAAPVQLEADPAALAIRIVGGDAAGAASAGARTAQALAALAESGVVISEFALGQPSLDEVFLALTGHTSPQEESSSVQTEETEGAA